MSFTRDDDDMLDHEKWRRALRDGGDSALLVWWRLRAWCARRLTDGVIPPDMIAEVAELARSKSRARALQALVEHGLCTRSECGTLTISGYLERNPSRAHVESERRRRASTEQSRRDTRRVTGHDAAAPPERAHVPIPIPIPSLSKESESDARAPEVPGLERVGGVARTYSMPSELPPKAYLDTALMGGVSPAQAKSTWKHYWGAGLPLSGVERLHDWLTLRAVERSNQVARAPQSGPRQSPSDLDTTGAATAFRLTDGHREYAGAKGIDAELAAREYRQGSACARLDSLEQGRDFLNRLKCWHATGTFHPDGPLPQPIKAPKEARA